MIIPAEEETQHTLLQKVNRICFFFFVCFNDENQASVTRFFFFFYKIIFEHLGRSFQPDSTDADFTNWFPFIQRGELITEISRCRVWMD